MKNNGSDVVLYLTLVVILCLSFGYNMHLHGRLQSLEKSNHFWRCGTTENEFYSIQKEIERLDKNPLGQITIGEPKSVLLK